MQGGKARGSAQGLAFSWRACYNKGERSIFFTDHYDHPIYECGVQLVDMVYLQRAL